MIDKLFELIRDGQHVVSIKLTGGFPPHTANYELIDGTVHKLALQMTADEYKVADATMRDWCNILSKLKILGE